MLTGLEHETYHLFENMRERQKIVHGHIEIATHEDSRNAKYDSIVGDSRNTYYSYQIECTFD